MKSKFQPGDRVRLNSAALMENMDKGGRTFPHLDENSVLIVVRHEGYTVEYEPINGFFRIHESWVQLVPNAV